MNGSSNGGKRTSQGRRKIEMKKIERVNNRQVTFSKRRCGLFKKASELCVLTGAEVAILVSSPGGHLFSFGHPSADAVVDRYLAVAAAAAAGGGGTGSTTTASAALLSDQSQPLLDAAHHSNQRYAEVLKELEQEKSRKVMIEEAGSDGGLMWWEQDVDGLGVEQLRHYLAALEELRKKVALRAEELRMMKANSPMLPINPIRHFNHHDSAAALLPPPSSGFGDAKVLD